MIQSKYFTHYSYLCGPENMCVPEDFFDLGAMSIKTRRQLVHELLDVGRLLAKLPEGFNIAPDRRELEDFLNTKEP